MRRPLLEGSALVGQGPNQESWKCALSIESKTKASGQYRIACAESECARLAITGRLGERLADMLGVDRLHLYGRCKRVNLNRRWTGKSGKGDAFDGVEGCEAAAELEASESARFVCLGRAVWRCFGFADEEFLTVKERNRKSFLLFPHPSGINLWWNDGRKSAKAARALRRFLLAPKSANTT